MLNDQGHKVHFVAGRKDRFLDLGIQAIVDAQPECGPMAGLVSAAQHCIAAQHFIANQDCVANQAATQNTGWFLLVSCDQLYWQSTYFHALAKRVNQDLMAITYCDPELQPIPGLYHTQIEALASQALAQRQLSLKRLLESLNEAVVSFNDPENPRAWCFNSETELKALLGPLGLKFEK